jgi:hypothetical protein
MLHPTSDVEFSFTATEATSDDSKVIEKSILEKNARPNSPVEVIDGLRYRYAVGGKFTDGPDGEKIQIWSPPKPAVEKKERVAKSYVDMTSYRAINRSRKQKLEALPDWNSEEFAAAAHEVAVAAANQTIEVKVAEPVFRKPGSLKRLPPRTFGEIRREKEITEKSAAAIAQAHQVYNEFIQVPTSTQSYTSTPEAPLTFGNNNWLKFQVITAIMESAGFAVPSSRLASMHTVNDVINDIVSHRAKYVEHLQSKERRPYPKNVTIVRESKKAGSKTPVGLRHKLNME